MAGVCGFMQEEENIIPENRSLYGMNVTEYKLFLALKKIGLEPETQYPVSSCVIDFAFPSYNWAFEVNGPHHYTEEGKQRDRKRRQFLHHTYPPWKIKSFKANRVFKNPDGVAREIKNIIEKDSEGGDSLGGLARSYRHW